MKILLILITYINFLKINNIKSFIVFPLKTLPKNNYIFSQDNSEKSIIKKFYYSDIYTPLEIGNNPQKVPLFISVSKNIFQITSSLSSSSFEDPEIYNLLPLFTNNNNIFFNEENSDSFQYNDIITSENKKSCLGNDTLFFFNSLDMNKKLQKTINFELLLKFQKEKLTGEIGLAFPDQKENNYLLIKKSNILFQLKENKLINNYNYFFLYDKWDNINGKLIIGATPHEILPKQYSKKDLILLNSKSDSSIGHNWKITFRDIYLDNFHLKNLTTELIFDSEAIIAPKELDTLLLKNFLQEEINNKKCFQERYYLKSHYVTTLKYYYCDINIQKEIYENLPNIKLNSKEFNYTFEINKNDLLQIEGNQIFFKILFFIEDYGIWLLGKPFTLKYQFVFNPDTKQIGMYNPDFVYEKQKWNTKKFWLIFTIIILCIIFTVLGIIIGKKIYGLRRKQKAFELDDNFEYISAIDNKKNKINDINNNISNTVSNYKTIEMNTKLY